MKFNNKPAIIIIFSLILLLMSTTTACAYINYSVRTGDSLFKLSNQFDTKVSTIKQLNNIQNPNLIYTNQHLKLPGESKINKFTNQTSRNNLQNDSQQTLISSQDEARQQKKIFTARVKTEADKQKVVYHHNQGVNKIALTFDDGPDNQYTPQILEVLNKYNVKATFFLLGQLSRQNPEVVNQIIRAGHTIGNHSWSHADLTQITEPEITQELDNTTEALQQITGRKPTLLRPPYGKTSQAMLAQLEATDYEIIHWSIDTLDWKAKETQEILDRVLPQIKPGAIILLHSAGGPTQDLTPTVQALPTIIEAVRGQGIELVTVDELLSLPAYG